ncbi:MAG TPA: hypothetical protein VL173_08460 [Vicinamibacterales bacterium]|nr:hypothetical protein [Vicinamibacterales bacterium]
MAVLAATFLLRWITLNFDNDYFMHLAWAAQMRHGEWPVREFVEPGFVLQTLFSYLGFAIGGDQLVAEGLIACAFIALGAACVVMAVRRAGGGLTLALIAAAIGVLAYPRSYAYPKAFLYPAFAWAIVAHARAPGPRTVTLLAGMTAIGFLFRHDHGLWLSVAAVAAIVAEYWPSWRHVGGAVTRFAAIGAVIVSPWVAWVAFSGHATEYVDNLLEGQSTVTSVHVPDTYLTIDRSAPLVAVAPVEYPRIAVRWSASLTRHDRVSKERQFGLEPIAGSGGRYRLTNISRANIRALLADPVVEDTNDIDRRTQQLAGGRLVEAWVRLQQYVPLVRLRLWPGVIQRANTLTLLSLLVFLTPWIAAIVITVDKRHVHEHRPAGPVERWPRSALIAITVLAIAGYHGLVRNSPDSRLGDVASLTGILLAYLASRLWHVPGVTRFLTRTITIAVIGLGLLLSTWFGEIFGRTGGLEAATWTQLGTHVRAIAAAYAKPPRETFLGPRSTGLDRLAGWLDRCTDRDSRVFVVGFEPQVFVLSERPFAAGLAFAYEGASNSPRNQRLAIERWSRQRVPVVIAVASTWGEFSRDYALLRSWIDEHYRLVAQSPFEGNKPLAVYVNIASPAVGPDEATGLPCFTR